MRRQQAAEQLRRVRGQILAELLTIDGWGGPEAEVRAGLDVVLDDLCTALAFGSSGLTDRALCWWKVRVRTLGGDVRQAVLLPSYLLPLAASKLPAEAVPGLEALLANADAVVSQAPDRAPVGADLDPGLAPGGIGRGLVDAMLDGDRLGAGVWLGHHGGSPLEALREGVEPALRELGARWQNGEVDPHVEHVASRIATQLVAHVARQVVEPGPDAPLVALLRAEGDEHSLGQACLRVHLTATGLRSRIVAAEAEPAAVLAMIEAVGASAVAISCTLTRQLAHARELVQGIRSCPSLAALPVLVGGGVFSDVPQLVSQLGADGTACSGAQAAEELARLLGLASAAR